MLCPCATPHAVSKQGMIPTTCRSGLASQSSSLRSHVLVSCLRMWCSKACCPKRLNKAKSPSKLRHFEDAVFFSLPSARGPGPTIPQPLTSGSHAWTASISRRRNPASVCHRACLFENVRNSGYKMSPQFWSWTQPLAKSSTAKAMVVLLTQAPSFVPSPWNMLKHVETWWTMLKLEKHAESTGRVSQEHSPLWVNGSPPRCDLNTAEQCRYSPVTAAEKGTNTVVAQTLKDLIHALGTV